MYSHELILLLTFLADQGTGDGRPACRRGHSDSKHVNNHGMALRRADRRMKESTIVMRARDGEVVPPPSPRRPPPSPRARPGPPPSSPLARPALAGCLGALAECPLLRCGVRTRRQPQHVARATRVHGAESFARAARQRAYARHILFYSLITTCRAPSLLAGQA